MISQKWAKLVTVLAELILKSIFKLSCITDFAFFKHLGQAILMLSFATAPLTSPADGEVVHPVGSGLSDGTISRLCVVENDSS